MNTCFRIIFTLNFTINLGVNVIALRRIPSAKDRIENFNLIVHRKNKQNSDIKTYNMTAKKNN